MSAGAVIEAFALGAPPWPTDDPFLFCVHHKDDYPPGNLKMGVDEELLRGRRIGMDFQLRDGFRMYHGDSVPGFPRHPHRGFETITLARHGLLDHSDSLGAKARFGRGDVQWMTAGAGISHSEMFPLVRDDQRNLAELFQIWINLPAEDKMTPPVFAMLWSETIPRVPVINADGKKSEVDVMAGVFQDAPAPAPPPRSWASREEAEVAIYTIRMEAGATLTLPAASPGLGRTLYFFEGDEIEVGGVRFDRHAGIKLRSSLATWVAAKSDCELLMLQGRAIREPVAHQGPFVMNTRDELRQAIRDYQRTRFGTWPHGSDAPVHARELGRFAVHSDGRHEEPGA